MSDWDSGPQHIGSTAPFRNTAKEYREKGWDVVPLPERRKEKPPKGFTGGKNKGCYATEIELERWFRAVPKANIAVHPGREVIVNGVSYEVVGIDVDDYEPKNGWFSLATLEGRYGKLPDTWISSARNDCRSGIRWFLVPYGYTYRSQVAESIETVQHTHRYGVVYPSWHPDTGGQYFWYEPGQVPNGRDFAHEIPNVTQLSLLGEHWFKYLRKDILSFGDIDNHINSPELFKWARQTLAHGENKCRLVSRMFNKHLQTITQGPDHHDPLVIAHWNLLTLGAEGHSGALLAVREIERAWKDRIINEGNERTNWVADAECARSLVEALRKIKSQVDSGIRTLETEDSCTAKVKGSKDPITDQLAKAQVRLAKGLCDRYEGRLIYVPNIGWHYWDGTRWQEDILGRITQYVIATIARFLRIAIKKFKEAEQMVQGTQRENLEAYAKRLFDDANSCQKASAIDGVIKIARSNPKVSVPSKDLDADPYLINMRNGTLNLKTGAMQPHSQTDFITKCCNATFDPKAKCPGWLKFLGEVLPDPEVREFVATLMGLGLIGTQLEHILVLFYGYGRNGKGVTEETLRYVYGDYAVSVASDLFTANPGSHTTSQTDLLGKRFAIIDELEHKAKTHEALIKKMTGDGMLTARKMRQDNIRFAMTWLLVLVTNYLPVIEGDSAAIWDRIVVVPFPVYFDEDRRDKFLRETLKEEADGIFMWAYEGWLQYQRDGAKLKLPAVVQEANKEYRHQHDKVQMWIDERCQIGSGDLFMSRPVDLNTDFNSWAFDQENTTQLGKKQFMQALRQKGYRYVSRTAIFLGIRLDPGRPKSKAQGAQGD